VDTVDDPTVQTGKTNTGDVPEQLLSAPAAVP
jgi:hypothetical protein